MELNQSVDQVQAPVAPQPPAPPVAPQQVQAPEDVPLGENGLKALQKTREELNAARAAKRELESELVKRTDAEAAYYNQRIQEYEAALQEHQTALQQQQQDMIVHHVVTQVNSALAPHLADPQYSQMLLNAISPAMELDAQGNIQMVLEDGGRIPLEKALPVIRSHFPHLFKATNTQRGSGLQPQTPGNGQQGVRVINKNDSAAFLKNLDAIATRKVQVQ
jgi:hypothetical protein